MPHKIGKYEFKAEAFRCNMLGYLPYQQMGNYMLDAADMHANDRDFGMDYLMPRHLAWVLSRFSLEMTAMPRPYEPFAIETWVESTMKLFTSRNFRVVGEGRTFGYGRSIWAMIDTATRQPANILAIRDGEMQNWTEPGHECPIEPPAKFRFNGAERLVRTVETRFSDADINGHINSMRYIEHILNLWPPEWHREHFVRRIDMSYMVESHCGDLLNFYLDEKDGAIGVRVTKHAAGIPDEADTCRCRILV